MISYLDRLTMHRRVPWEFGSDCRSGSPGNTPLNELVCTGTADSRQFCDLFHRVHALTCDIVFLQLTHKYSFLRASHRYINIITYRSTPWNKILCKLFSSWYDFSFSKDNCSMNLSKLHWLLSCNQTTISSISSAALYLNTKNRSKSWQNLLRQQSVFTYFRLIRIGWRHPHAIDIDPYFRVSKKAAALSVVLFYHSQSRTSSATTCQSVYAVVPKCFH